MQGVQGLMAACVIGESKGERLVGCTEYCLPHRVRGEGVLQGEGEGALYGEAEGVLSVIEMKVDWCVPCCGVIIRVRVRLRVRVRPVVPFRVIRRRPVLSVVRVAMGSAVCRIVGALRMALSQ